MKEHTSLELSKRLHDKGFRGEHEKMYAYDGERGLRDKDEHWEIIGPAYTFTEIWGVLPTTITVEGLKYWATCSKNTVGMVAGYYRDEGDDWTHWLTSHTPAEAVGLLLEWLIDNGHVETS